MEFSRYNFYLNEYPEKGYTTIYNMFSKKAVCYRSELLYPEIASSVQEKLSQYGIITFCEDEDFNKLWAHYIDRTESPHILKIMLVLTGECNCACTYCYEKALGKLPVGFRDTEKLFDFVADQFEKKDITYFEVIYYGGEPLLYKDLITDLSCRFRTLYGSIYHFAIITNGTLIDADSVNRWADLGLGILKISVDGCQESNDQRRKYKDGSGTYRDILDRLQCIPDTVEKRINIVIDKSVYGIETLLDEIDEKNIKAKYSINPVEPWKGTWKEKADLIIKYATILKTRNKFQYSKLSATHGDLCEGKYKNFYVIDGYGRVYECNGEFRPIGDLDNGIHRTNFCFRDECRKCRYLPLCYGDCFYYENCKKEYFDYLVPRLLKVYLSYSKV